MVGGGGNGLPGGTGNGGPLTERDLGRYARHITLAGFGSDAQRRLRASRVLVIGAGGLGSPVLLYLAAAGVGHITIIDDDTVDASNLQRQVIHRECDIGRPKAQSAADAVKRLDQQMSVDAIVGKLSTANARRLFTAHDIVLDGADNFATRYLSNDAAEITRTPLVWGTISQFTGQLSVFWPGRGPMLRDLYPDIPDPDSVPSCAAGGVLGAMVGQVGSMMAIEAIKVLTGVGTPAIGSLVLIDALTTTTRRLNFTIDPDRPPVTDLSDIDTVCGDAAAWEEDSSAAPSPAFDTISAYQAHAVISSDAAFCAASNASSATNASSAATPRRVVVIDVRETEELAEGFIHGSIHVPLRTLMTVGWDGVVAASERKKIQTDYLEDVIVYCRSGARSAQALQVLGADPAIPSTIALHNLDGGILSWNAGPGSA